MKQVSQNLRNGIINVEEVPIPGLKDNFFTRQKEHAYLFDIWGKIGYKPFAYSKTMVAKPE